ncbi:YggS family pyridoxal phosphate-dependent enzyme [Vreelandella utahensis]|uniref:YggS family pyridoxal phosphate-dependent enzyme n=1 Tax=Vreelandella halophila TaxID=86177 RepID=UPI000985AA3F|nr:YggS family pyridoxal phosphate-dependent enzyme [Halomonas utahensis]
MISIAENLEKAATRIRSAAEEAERDPAGVQLLAVSKTKPAELLREAAEAGQKAFGENYIQEALDKIEALSDLPDLEWHFIGPLQSNKTRPVAEHFSWVHSIDRAKVARRLSEQRPAGMAPLNLCIQVNIDDEPTKSGVRPEEVPGLAQELSGLEGCRLRGLMAIPDPANPAAVQRERFRELAGLLAEVRRGVDNGALDTLSMGMSGDLEAAIAEGATIVRLGTALFGPRDYEAQ